MTEHILNHDFYSMTIDDVLVNLFIDESIEDTPETFLSVISPHKHIYNELFVCERELAVVVADNCAYILNAGDMLIVPANLPHRTVCPKRSGSLYAVGFSFEKLESENGNNLYRSIQPIISGEIICLKSHLELCTELIRSIGDASRNIPGCTVLGFMDFILKVSSLLGNYTVVKNSTLDDNDLNRISLIEHYISTAFMNNLTYEYFTDILHISRRQLARIIRKRYGKSLHEAICEKRTEAAANLLKNTSLPISQISQLVGFGSVSAFNREFLAFFSMSPREFRAMSGSS